VHVDAETTTQAVLLHVCDNGPGVPDETGNVRELKAVVESAGALILPDQHDVDAELLRLASGDATPPAAAAGSADASAGPLDAALNELELRLVRDAMTAAGGNQSEAARRLGVSRVGLIKKLTRLGLR
jgi:two-component system NtrC family response regulator